jgi:hypothetical protein
VSFLGQTQTAVAIFVGTTVHSYKGMWVCSFKPLLLGQLLVV